MKQSHHLAVNLGVGGQAFTLVQIIGLAGEIAHQATGLGDQQRTGRHVPGMQAGFKKSIAETGGHIGQVQGSCAGTAHTGGAFHHFAHHAQVSREIVAFAKRKTGGDQAFLHAYALAHAQAAVVQKSAASAGGGE